MRFIGKVLVGLMSIVCIGLAVMLVVGVVKEGGIKEVTTAKKNVKEGKVQMVKETSVDASGITNFIVDNGKNAFGIHIYQGQDNTFLVREYMSFEPTEEQYATIETRNGTVYVTGVNFNSFSSWFHSLHYSGYIEVYLPLDYKSDLEVQTSSGEINLKDNLELGDVRATTASGKLSLQNLNASKDIMFATSSGKISGVDMVAAKVKAETSSGEIAFDRVTAEIIRMSSNSGRITVAEANGVRDFITTSGSVLISGGTGDTDVITTSGSIRVSNSEGNLDLSSTSGSVHVDRGGAIKGKIKTVSGAVDVALTELSGDINCTSTSGSVTVQIPDGLDFNFYAYTTSGSIKTYFEDMLTYNVRLNEAKGAIGEHAKYTVGVKTTSGAIKITR